MTTVHTYRYGNDPSQRVNLFLPVGDYLPLVVVIHGGFWRSRYSVDLADPLAMELTRFGVAAAAVEYRRVGNGGGWPTTLADVARAVDQLATQGQQLAEGRLRLDRVAAVGHSAGGQLAAWLTHRGSLRQGTAGSIAPGQPYVPMVGAVAQAGVLDLAGAAEAGLGRGAVIDLMDEQPGSVPQRYFHASPLSHVGDGARVVCVHGDQDDEVPLWQSEKYVAAAEALGDPVKLMTLPGIGHYELIDPDHAAWGTCRDAALQMV